MPPKPKVTKEHILQGALSIVRKGGTNALTAKALAKELSCSTQPIFWHYESMDSLKKEVFEAALAVFGERLRIGDPHSSPYLTIGLNYIRFATEERELFRLLFMSDFGQRDLVSSRVEMDYILGIIEASEDISDENAQIIYREMWLFSHGIAAMIATRTAAFTEKEVRDMLSDVYRGLIGKFKITNFIKKE